VGEIGVGAVCKIGAVLTVVVVLKTAVRARLIAKVTANPPAKVVRAIAKAINKTARIIAKQAVKTVKITDKGTNKIAKIRELKGRILVRENALTALIPDNKEQPIAKIIAKTLWTTITIGTTAAAGMGAATEYHRDGVWSASPLGSF
jgi:predicted transcriptional regulator